MQGPHDHHGGLGDFIDTARHRLLHGDPTAAYVRLLRGLVTLSLLLAFGVAGYMVIEGWSFSDSLYMTVTTVTTVGYNEVHPLSEGGRVFTVFVILFGVGTALYILTILVQTVIEGELAAAFGVRRMQARIDALSDHYILCGFGRVGEEIAAEFAKRDVPFVIVEYVDEAVERSFNQGYLVVEGDATKDDILERAGIERARALMAASDSDAGNTYITLAAKALRPDLYVIARIGQAGGESRARRAGANRVISPYSLAGRRMALSALQPLTVDFFDLMSSERGGDQILAELVVTDESIVVNQEAHEAMHLANSTTLLAIQHESGDVVVGPPDSYRLQSGDRLMLLSNESDLTELGRTKEGAVPEIDDVATATEAT
jgi:voltage-gated potassium channel